MVSVHLNQRGTISHRNVTFRYLLYPVLDYTLGSLETANRVEAQPLFDCFVNPYANIDNYCKSR